MMKINSSKEKRSLFIKSAVRWLLYFLVIFLCFIIMTSGTWKKPLLLIPAALCISVNSSQIPAAVTGAACGFLIDISCGKLVGYNAVILSVFCILVSLLFELYLKNRFITIMLASAASSWIIGWLDYKFYYEIWKYENVEKIFYSITVPVWAYTVVSTIFIYLIIKFINFLLLPKETLSLEEAIKTPPKN